MLLICTKQQQAAATYKWLTIVQFEIDPYAHFYILFVDILVYVSTYYFAFQIAIRNKNNQFIIVLSKCLLGHSAHSYNKPTSKNGVFL